MFKTDILFTGFYGQSNTGDDAFVEVASWGSKKYWKKNNIRFLAVKENLPKGLNPLKGYPFSIPKTFRIQERLLLRSGSALVSAGGSTIHSELTKNNIKQLAIQRKHSHPKFKIGAIGVSIGPFKNISDEKAVTKYLREIDFLAVRDQTSFSFVESLNLPYKAVNSFDLAALLPDIYGLPKKYNTPRDKKVIGVSVCRYESIHSDLDNTQEIRRNNMIVELLKTIDEISNIHFKFFIINGNSKNGDIQITHETISRVNPKSYEILQYSKRTEKVWTSIVTCDFIISTRLHAAIFACFGGTPFMLNEYHRKCSDFLENINYCEDYRLFNSEYDIKDRAYKIINIINDNTCYKFPNQINEMKKMAEFNFNKIDF